MQNFTMMNYGEYLKGISFRLYRPMENFSKYERLSDLLKNYGVSLEILNTRLPEDSARMRRTLKPLRRIPRMSTYAIAAMINRAVSEMADDECFVNVGVWHGFTLLSGMLNNPGKKCIGIDNFSEFGGPREEFLERFRKHKSANHQFQEMDYEKYFSNVHKGPIGFYIYDGEHSYENQLKGMQVAEPFFSKNCRILIDDTNLPAARRAIDDFMARSRNKYQILLDRRTSKNLHPTLWNGVTILQRTD
jgi:hypothetical protein